MENLGSYSDSDSDSSENQKTFIPTPPSISNKKHFLPPKNQKSRTKSLNISLLPQEIQLALRRGDSLLDSDEDETYSNRTTYKSQPFETKTDLLKLLPKPKENLSTSTKTKNMSDQNLPISDRVDSFQKSRIPPQTESSDSENSGSEDSKSLTSVHKIPLGLNVNPNLVSKAFIIPAFTRLDPSPLSTESTDTLMLFPQPFPTNKYEIKAPFEKLESLPFSSSTSNKRRREKEIEQELLRGNTSAIERFAPAEISAPNKNWNPDEYSLKLKKEQEVLNSFHIGTGQGSVQQANKLQHRKHQINSLAMRAAETELKLLESQGYRMKTKSETQAKYGW